jgi:Putative addiction module component
MNSSLEQLKDTLSALPLADREELADYLLSTLEFEEEVKVKWLAVAEQRMASPT